MFNYKLFKAKILIKGSSVETLSQALGISTVTFYRKVNNDGSFYRNEIIIIARELDLTEEEIKDIFFAEKLA